MIPNGYLFTEKDIVKGQSLHLSFRKICFQSSFIFLDASRCERHVTHPKSLSPSIYRRLGEKVRLAIDHGDVFRVCSFRMRPHRRIPLGAPSRPFVLHDPRNLGMEGRQREVLQG